MIFQKKQFVYLALGASIISLGACGYSHPNSMPSGYTYHHDTYKSPASAESAKVTIEQRQYMDATQAEQFRNSVYDLLEKLTMRAGMPPKPVYIMAPDPMTTFYANIDNDLRESMRHIGYAISDTSEGAYIFTYEAQPILQVDEEAVQTANNVDLTLRVFSGLDEEARQLTEQSGQYFIQGADSLNIAASRYSLLPSQEQVQSQQVEAIAPQIVEPATVELDLIPPAPVMPAPVAVEDSSIIENSVSVVVSKPVMEEPLVSRPSPDVEVTPVVEEVKETVKKEISLPKLKKPSRDDIIIINRGDKPVVDADIEAPVLEVEAPVLEVEAPVLEVEAPVVDVVPEVEDVLQDTTPNSKDVVRPRVSMPVDY